MLWMMHPYLLGRHLDMLDNSLQKTAVTLCLKVPPLHPAHRGTLDIMSEKPRMAES